MCRAALGGAPMVVGGGGAGAMVQYAEVELTAMGGWPTFIGVGRAGLDVGREWANQMAEFWGMSSGDGDLCHAGQRTNWAERQNFTQGDTLGLLLDCAQGTLAYYKNGERLGVAAEGLTGELCWAAALHEKGGSLRLTAKLPPAGVYGRDWQRQHHIPFTWVGRGRRVGV